MEVLGPEEQAHAISVVMPVYNAAHFLKRTIQPLVDMRERGELLEVIAVDDGSQDSSAMLAAELGAVVISSGGRLGPGGARNVGAQRARGGVLWFVDADVIAHVDVAARVLGGVGVSGVVAVFGSYDDRPAALNFGSQYKNLVHHHYHAGANKEASTFWAGCGAVSRKAFLAIGGFDAERYQVPSIEDVDLGHRLRAAGGRIRLDSGLLGTHLKRWSIRELVRTDIFRRALPWAELMLTRSGVIDDLNVGRAERLRAFLAGCTVLGLVLAVFAVVPAWTAATLVAAALAANWRLFRLFKRRQGVPFAVAGIAFHQVYYLYSAAAFAWVWSRLRIISPARS